MSCIAWYVLQQLELGMAGGKQPLTVWDVDDLEELTVRYVYP